MVSYLTPRTTLPYLSCRRLSRLTTPIKTFDRLIPAGLPRPPYISGDSLTTPTQTPLHPPLLVQEIRLACRVVRNILSQLGPLLQPGVTTQQIDNFVYQQCLQHGVYPSPLGYNGFPKSVCTSINSVACHGIPSDLVALSPGDIISVDISVYNGQAHGDACETFVLGRAVSRSLIRSVDLLNRHARLARDVGVAVCRPGVPLGEVGAAIEAYANSRGFRVIPNIRGHGIGPYFHGPPDVCHHKASPGPGCEDLDLVLRPGMVFTVEPCLTEGEVEVELGEDGWTLTTVDGSRCAQYEHTLHITERGCEVLT